MFCAHAILALFANESRMPDRDYFMTLAWSPDSEDRIQVRIRTDHAQVVDFESLINQQIDAVVRCDGSHRRGHCDSIDRSGHVIQKQWLPDHVMLAKALNVGLADIIRNWRQYRRTFLAREGFEEDQP